MAQKTQGHTSCILVIVAVSWIFIAAVGAALRALCRAVLMLPILVSAIAIAATLAARAGTAAVADARQLAAIANVTDTALILSSHTQYGCGLV